MDYGAMLSDAFTYAKDAVIGKWKQWFLLIVATVLLFLPLLGYSLKVLRGEKPAPEVTGWGTLFVDGIKYLVLSLIYAIPALIVLFITLGGLVFAIISGNTAHVLALIGGVILGLIVFVIVAVITGLFSMIGLIRFARTGSMGEAFNFGAILATIGKIGWGSYVLAWVALLIVQVIIGVIIGVFYIIPALGILVELVFIAPIVLFQARYFCQVYDSAGPV